MSISIRRWLRPAFVAPAIIALLTACQGYAGEIFAPDGVAIHGYDPVAYFTEKRPVEGSQKFSTTYKGATFHFASAAHRDAFVKNPERYAPQYGGFCAYGTARGYKASTEPQAFSLVDGKLYLNYDDNIKKTWSADTSGYIDKADANWDSVKKQ